MIYIHVPFCRSFCTYCDFYSEVAAKNEGSCFELYAACACEEIRGRAEEIRRSSEAGVHTLYIGGGTPSVLPLSCLKQIVDTAAAADDSGWQEFTVEVNPDDITPEYLQGLKSLGVTRISMGVQSLDDKVLKWMNRRHDSAEAVNAVKLIRSAGFGNLSLDLIFGVNGCSVAESLCGIIALRPEHISAYQLSIEEGSALGKMVREGRYEEASEDQCRAEYELICEKLREAGYLHYEISNWALPSKEAVHNSAYWKRLPYVGIGPGAHSLSITPEGQVRSWNAQVRTGWAGKGGSETLTKEEIEEERLMLGLRTTEGVDDKVIPEKDWFIADTIISDLLVSSR